MIEVDDEDEDKVKVEVEVEIEVVVESNLFANILYGRANTRAGAPQFTFTFASCSHYIIGLRLTLRRSTGGTQTHPRTAGTRWRTESTRAPRILHRVPHGPSSLPSHISSTAY